MKINFLYLYVYTILVFLLWGCQTGVQQKEGDRCVTQPAAIFSDTMEVVAQHSFSVENQESIEEVELTNGVRLSIFQSGCEAIRQEFRISRQGDYREMPDPAWINNAYMTLEGLAATSPELGGLASYADFIAQHKTSIRLGKPFQADPHLSITLDKITSREEGTILFILEGS